MTRQADSQLGKTAALGRRGVLLLPLASLTGCGLWNRWFGDDKPPLPGTREPILPPRRGLEITPGASPPRITLPPVVSNEAWPQPGGNPTHTMGHLAAAPALREVWRVNIGEGGGYRKKILASPIVADGVVFAMDSSGVISALDLATGGRRWKFNTVRPDDDSTNVGGGMTVSDETLYAVNGLADLIALNPANGAVRWRRRLDTPARSAPTVVEGRLFFVTIDDKLLCCSTEDGRQLWSHQAVSAVTSVLGTPAPAFADGLVVAGFGSGEVACLRGATGTVAWTESIAAARGRNSLADLSAIRGLPVIADGRVYAISLGRLMVSLDLRSGRRLWEREIAGQDILWVAGDWIFFISADQQAAAVNRTDSSVGWVTELPRWDNPEKQEDPLFWFGPVLAGDRLIVVGTNKQALSLSPSTGEIIGRQPLSAGASLAPIVVNGTVIIVTDDGAVLALR